MGDFNGPDLKDKKLFYIISLEKDECQRTRKREDNILAAGAEATGFTVNEWPWSKATSGRYTSSYQSRFSSNGGGEENLRRNAICIRSALKLTDLLKQIAETYTNIRCLLVYVIATQYEEVFQDEDGEPYELFRYWDFFRGKKYPTAFFIQANISGDGFARSALMNLKGVAGAEDKLPSSANNLVAYLPNYISGSLEKSVAEVFGEELRNPYELHTILTEVNRRTMTQKHIPRFSSTFLSELYFNNGNSAPEKMRPTPYKINHSGNCLVYSFLFAKFDPETKLSDLFDCTVSDVKRLEETFKHVRFNYRPLNSDPNLYMECETFKSTFEDILNPSKNELLKTCEFIMFAISSHGDTNGRIFASDGEVFTRDYLLEKMSQCEELNNKPKALLINACRGSSMETTGKSIIFDPEEPSVYKGQMPDVIQILSTIECRVSAGFLGEGCLLFDAFSNELKEHGGVKDIYYMTIAALKSVAERNLGDKYSKQQMTFTSSLKHPLLFPV